MTGRSMGRGAAVWVEWDFRDGPRTAALPGPVAELDVRGSVTWIADAGGVGCFRFKGGHLRIPAERVGQLHLAARGEDSVSVVALLRRGNTAPGFIAGMWQEDDRDPRRQYGLFTSLPVYGGDQKVCGHVSGDGRSSPGLPYSRDYATSGQYVPVGTWVVAGFTYDGAHVRAFLDGEMQPVDHYTEPGPPYGFGLSYAKNPYAYADGLNREAVSDFTVGAVKLTSGIGNRFDGEIARLLVTSDALSAVSMRDLARDWAPLRNRPPASVGRKGAAR